MTWALLTSLLGSSMQGFQAHISGHQTPQESLLDMIKAILAWPALSQAQQLAIQSILRNLNLIGDEGQGGCHFFTL